ncbi:MAG: sn-glycerol-1-phosphate dehydrogenase [Clostridia bacterium]|nr:sn-glycerol-1-phosphate dehydrogenase [Clostridia bacterium]
MNVYDLINKDIKCSCGRVHRCNISGLKIGADALAELPELVAGYAHVLVAADWNTAPLASDRVCALLGEKLERLCLFGQKTSPAADGDKAAERLVPDEERVEELRGYLTEKTDLVLGIGSGVINDLCKYVAFYAGIRSGIVATAASMDGYASSGAAMIIKGMKVTVTVNAPDIIVGDTGLLATAPDEMSRAGYADIIGKYSSLNDWKLSALVNGEYICPEIVNIVKESTDEIRALAPEIAARTPEALGKLMEILVLVGCCLTLTGTTRPGSGSEHHLSHFFEITGLIHGEPYFIHGIDVGYSTVETARMRETIRKIGKPVFSRLSDDLRIENCRRIFGSYADEVMSLQTAAGRYANTVPEKLYSEKWPDVVKILSECPTADEITEMLTAVGFDMSEFQKMYRKDKIKDSTYFAKDLKDRYSVLWLYYDLFSEKTIVKRSSRSF